MFRNDNTKTNDDGAFRSISDCTPGMEERAVAAVLRNCQGAEDGVVLLSVLGLTGTAEGMLAARDARAG